MENIKVQKIINDSELAKKESIEFFKKIKEKSLFCKEIIVSSRIIVDVENKNNKAYDMSFGYKNVKIEPEDIHIKDDNSIQIDVFDKFAFFINNNCTNFKYDIQSIKSKNQTILCIHYNVNDIIKNIIYISF